MGFANRLVLYDDAVPTVVAISATSVTNVSVTNDRVCTSSSVSLNSDASGVQQTLDPLQITHTISTNDTTIQSASSEIVQCKKRKLSDASCQCNLQLEFTKMKNIGINTDGIIDGFQKTG
jgi:hypothetical protein